MNVHRRFAVAALVAIVYGAVAFLTGTSAPKLVPLALGSLLAMFGLLTPMEEAVSSDEGIRNLLVTKVFNALLVLSLVVMIVSVVA